MQNKVLTAVLFLAALASSAPRNAAAFDFLNAAQPLDFSKIRTPEVPIPAAAAPKTCKPFLLSTAVGGVAETVILERACTHANDPVWAITVEVRGRRPAAVRINSADYPEQRAALENRIKSMALEGLSQADADFIVSKTGPALKLAAIAAPEQKDKLLAAARAELKEFLVRP